MTAEVIQFVPRANPNRLSDGDRRAIALQDYVCNAGYTVMPSEMKQFLDAYDTTPSDYIAPSDDCA